MREYINLNNGYGKGASKVNPQGLDKMIVEEIEDLTITNDGATILKQIEVTHPATKFTANQVPVTYRH